MLLGIVGCKRGSSKHAEMMYVSVPQANVRDRISAVYNKVATVSAGDAVEVIEKQKRFIHIKTKDGRDGWIEERYLIGQDVFDGFEKLKKDNAKTPVQAHGTARATARGSRKSWRGSWTGRANARQTRARI